MAISGLGPGAMHVEYIESPRAYKASRGHSQARAVCATGCIHHAPQFRRDAAGRPHQANLPVTDRFTIPATYKFCSSQDWVMPTHASWERNNVGLYCAVLSNKK